MSRKLIGKRPLTNAEKQERWRQKEEFKEDLLREIQENLFYIGDKNGDYVKNVFVVLKDVKKLVNLLDGGLK